MHVFFFLTHLLIAMSTSLNLRMEILKKSDGKLLDGTILYNKCINKDIRTHTQHN